MMPISLIEKLKTIYNMISSNSLFLIALIITGILLLLIAISLIRHKKINIKLFLFIWLLITILIIIKYHKFILALGDSLIENVLMAIYFPNFAIFTIVLTISNISLFYNIIKKNISMIYKVIQIISAVLIDFLFILILDTVVVNNIDIYSQTEVYQNNNLFVLLETSMIIFTINVILTLIIFVTKKLLKHNKQKLSPKTQVELIDKTIIENNNDQIEQNPIRNDTIEQNYNTNIPPTNTNQTHQVSILNYNSVPNINTNAQYNNLNQATTNNLNRPIYYQESIMQYNQQANLTPNIKQTTINNNQSINTTSILHQTPIEQKTNQNDDIETLNI